MDAKTHFALFCAGLLLGLPVFGQSDWPQWRGPNRDGTVTSRRGPAEWPARLTRLWKREVGGGYSGPVAAQGSVWVHSRRGEHEVVTRLDLSTGEVLWTRGYRAPFEQDPTAVGHGRGPYSTPVVVGQRLVTLGVTTTLSVWEADSGKPLWQKDYAEEFDPVYPYFGTASSPIVWRDLCMVHFGGQEEADVGKLGNGAMIALRLEDGTEAWRWTGDSAAIGSTPVIAETPGPEQLIFKSRGLIVSVDALTGAERWRIPFQVPMDNTITTPLVLGDRLVTSDWEQGILAWGLTSSDSSSPPPKLWHTREVSLSMSSPVLVGTQIVGFSSLRKGQLSGLDPEDGKVLWQGERRWGEHATLIAWGDHLLTFREDGTLVVGEVTHDGLQALQRYRLGEPHFWSHPAILGNMIIVRTGKHLVVYRVGD